MSYELKGTLHRVMDVWRSETSDFYKREFVVSTEGEYPTDVKFTTFKERTEQLEGLKPGDKVVVKFDIKGREYNDRYYVDLNAWRVEKAAEEAVKQTETPQPQKPAGEDDLPF